MILPASDSLVAFALDEHQFAVKLSAVERVLPAVALAPPSAGASTGARGMINVQGTILPVFDPRTRFGLAVRDLKTTDHLLIVHTGQRSVALLVDSVSGIMEAGIAEAEVAPAAGVPRPGLQSVAGVMKCEGEILFIHDLVTFLSAGEAHTRAASMVV